MSESPSVPPRIRNKVPDREGDGLYQQTANASGIARPCIPVVMPLYGCDTAIYPWSYALTILIDDTYFMAGVVAKALGELK